MTGKKKNKLGPDSTMREIFNIIRPEKGCKVQAINLGDRSNGRVDLMIAITGSEAECSVLMANLMSYVDEMYDMAGKMEDEAEEAKKDTGDNVVDIKGEDESAS